MRPSDTDSKEGLYEVFYRDDGDRVIVLEGLSVDDVYAPPPLQEWIHTHYGAFELGYWLIVGSILLYVAGLHIVIPLMRRFGIY